MSADDPILSKIVRKLQMRTPLGEADIAAIMALSYTRRTYDMPAYVLREGEIPRNHCSFVVSGLAFRQKLTASGARQIVSIHMAGDFLDLQHLFLNRADHSVQALTRVEMAEIQRDALQDIIARYPNLARALWIDALIDASMFREWVLNVGRRDARSKVAHLLCEFALRMEAAGMIKRDAYELPMTQEQLGDAVGLTSVHVNRTLKSLAADGLIRRHRRHLTFDNWEKLREVADFSALYLHLDQANPPA